MFWSYLKEYALNVPPRTEWRQRAWTPDVGRPVVNFKSALESLVEAKACREHGTYGRGPDAWHLCHTPALRAPGCTVVGAGIADDDTFEVHVSKAFPNCNVTMVDPTPWVVKRYRDKPPTRDNLRFAPCGLATTDALMVLPTNAYNKQPDVVSGCTLQTLSPQSTTVLKMDIEGGEWQLFNASKHAPRSPWGEHGLWTIRRLVPFLQPLPDQIMFELHDGPPAAWLGLWRMLHSNGYAMWKATNPRFGGDACGPGCRYPGLSQPKRALAELYFVRTR